MKRWVFRRPFDFRARRKLNISLIVEEDEAVTITAAGTVSSPAATGIVKSPQATGTVKGV